MILSTFVSPETGNLLHYVPGTDEAFGFSIDQWVFVYAEEVRQRFEAEGLGRELVEANFVIVSTDVFILLLKVRWPDGRSATIREEILRARFTQRDGYWAIASIGGVPASQS